MRREHFTLVTSHVSRVIQPDSHAGVAETFKAFNGGSRWDVHNAVSMAQVVRTFNGLIDNDVSRMSRVVKQQYTSGRTIYQCERLSETV